MSAILHLDNFGSARIPALKVSQSSLASCSLTALAKPNQTVHVRRIERPACAPQPPARSIAARSTVVLECERMRRGPRQHQRRRENREGSQELLHVIHHLAFKLIEFHQENQVINGQKEVNVNFRSMRQLCDTVHSRPARIERKKQTNRPLGEVYLGVNYNTTCQRGPTSSVLDG